MKWISAECPECDDYEWVVTEEQLKSGIITCPECHKSFKAAAMQSHGFIHDNNDESRKWN